MREVVECSHFQMNSDYPSRFWKQALEHSHGTTRWWNQTWGHFQYIRISSCSPSPPSRKISVNHSRSIAVIPLKKPGNFGPGVTVPQHCLSSSMCTQTTIACVSAVGSDYCASILICLSCQGIVCHTMLFIFKKKYFRFLSCPGTIYIFASTRSNFRRSIHELWIGDYLFPSTWFS
jgi:hypothetical protein